MAAVGFSCFLPPLGRHLGYIALGVSHITFRLLNVNLWAPLVYRWWHSRSIRSLCPHFAIALNLARQCFCTLTRVLLRCFWWSWSWSAACDIWMRSIIRIQLSSAPWGISFALPICIIFWNTGFFPRLVDVGVRWYFSVLDSRSSSIAFDFNNCSSLSALNAPSFWLRPIPTFTRWAMSLLLGLPERVLITSASTRWDLGGAYIDFAQLNALSV